VYDKKVKKGELENEFTTIFRKKYSSYIYGWSCFRRTLSYFYGKLDTEEELYDEITIETNKYPYVGFNESVIKDIEVI
jgi:hypothetical protein